MNSLPELSGPDPVGAYLGFHSMKQQGVLSVQLPPEWNAGPSLGPDFPDNWPVSIHTPGWIEAL